jgi:hypothetical protein
MFSEEEARRGELIVARKMTTSRKTECDTVRRGYDVSRCPYRT